MRNSLVSHSHPQVLRKRFRQFERKTVAICGRSGRTKIGQSVQVMISESKAKISRIGGSSGQELLQVHAGSLRKS